jgi:hypothetical protein
VLKEQQAIAGPVSYFTDCSVRFHHLPGQGHLSGMLYIRLTLLLTRKYPPQLGQLSQ